MNQLILLKILTYMKNILLLSILLSVSLCIIEDEAFINKYSVVIHKRGTAT